VPYKKLKPLLWTTVMDPDSIPGMDGLSPTRHLYEAVKAAFISWGSNNMSWTGCLHVHCISLGVIVLGTAWLA
jgi:hypothetical protein